MSWNSIQIDALAEMMNVGVGQAAALLSEMIDHKIDLSVPAVSFIGKNELDQWFASEMPGGTVSIRQAFTGEMSGSAALFFLEESSAALVRMLLEDTLTAEEVLELEAEALSELGNIIINACLGTVANELATTLTIDLPEFEKGRTRFGKASGKPSAEPESIIVRIHLSSQPTGIGGLIVLFMDGRSQAHLRGCIDALLAETC